MKLDYNGLPYQEVKVIKLELLGKALEEDIPPEPELEDDKNPNQINAISKRMRGKQK